MILKNIERTYDVFFFLWLAGLKMENGGKVQKKEEKRLKRGENGKSGFQVVGVCVCVMRVEWKIGFCFFLVGEKQTIFTEGLTQWAYWGVGD